MFYKIVDQSSWVYGVSWTLQKNTSLQYSFFYRQQLYYTEKYDNLYLTWIIIIFCNLERLILYTVNNASCQTTIKEHTRNFLPWETGLMQLIARGLLFLMLNHWSTLRFSSISRLEKLTFLATATGRACIIASWKWLFRNISFKQQCRTYNRTTASWVSKHHTLLANCREWVNVQCNVQTTELLAQYFLV